MNSTDKFSNHVREPAVAGLFYPGTATELRASVERCLAQIPGDAATPQAKAIIAPHAGYVFSGTVAARAYAGWRDLGDPISRVVVLGPSHRVYLRGMALPASSAFITPLGRVDIDRELAERVRTMPDVVIDDTPHAAEHSIEVQLPFLQTLFRNFELLPVVVGDARATSVARLLEQVWGGPETRIVISTDLSHYQNYTAANAIDSATSAAIRTLQYEAIGPEQACGCMPLRGLLYYAREHGLRIDELARCNSGDTAGPRDQVVGYAAYALHD
ncbi:AmmeMemoRadiSam system protein B [Methylohalomonas lacus]|uniref:MEMO1 family protein J2T55_001524 n=1 Tax=Methylohalomonas lacus TaxID=398773 RepID=A0AAE3HLM4_9GAMM|nr:AmmeMemoRadiSam system protein B [Methylohalomonas lacus]MCS3903498.1 AmmeMemoRadiSam system protein B [Methylohalomonas lacus]